jgi:hypothetical protein
MLVIDEAKMTEIVNNNDKLSWIGWDVALDQKNPNGFHRNDGVFKNGNWYIRKVFPLNENGWNIPDNLVR